MSESNQTQRPWLHDESSATHNASELIVSDNVGTRLLFENERIRVWDLSLAPGEWVESHRHRLEFCFIVAQGGHLRHADPNNPQDAHEVSYSKNQVVYSEVGAQGTLHHRLTNIGDAPYQNYVIEFKTTA